ncbi:Oocyte-specific histone RNA stem-loop-binding protein 2 [Trichinella pseudospiralis]|uniref:Oocyte-specific histone RNA stem-loop-binding protein 2 n=1 Tax=Trichinella pseudospiralis TaxID=6337 RepID=A0A0V1F7X5_TRIPS|nr:Oocyte-specific histone RNA stem-loop-binding protein 2 [Trichinella pseudospiralis]
MHPPVNVTSTDDDSAIFASTEEELLPDGLLEDEVDENFAVTESIALAEQNEPSKEKDGFLEEKLNKETSVVSENLQSVTVAEQSEPFIEKDGLLEDKLNKEISVVSENLQSVTVAEQSEPFIEKDGLLENDLDKEVAAVTENSQPIANKNSELSSVIFHGSTFVTVSSFSGVANVFLNDVTTFAFGQVLSKHSNQAQYFKKIRRPPTLFAKEMDESVIARRAKDIQKGYNCEAYKYYLNAVPKHERIRGVHPVTPTKELKFSRRSWDAQIRLWRKNIHTAVHHQVIDEKPNFKEKCLDFYGGKVDNFSFLLQFLGRKFVDLQREKLITAHILMFKFLKCSPAFASGMRKLLCSSCPSVVVVQLSNWLVV